MSEVPLYPQEKAPPPPSGSGVEHFDGEGCADRHGAHLKWGYHKLMTRRVVQGYLTSKNPPPPRTLGIGLR